MKTSSKKSSKPADPGSSSHGPDRLTPEFMLRFGLEWIKHDVLLPDYRNRTSISKTCMKKLRCQARREVLRALELDPHIDIHTHFLKKYRSTLMSCALAEAAETGRAPTEAGILARVPPWARALEPRLRLAPAVSHCARKQLTKSQTRARETVRTGKETDALIPALRALWTVLRSPQPPAWPRALRAAAAAARTQTHLMFEAWNRARSVVLQKLCLAAWCGDRPLPPARLRPADRLVLDLALLHTHTRLVTEESVRQREQEATLRALLALVEHYRLHEGGAGLEGRWRTAARDYRAKGYCGGLVVLQKRWHELVCVCRLVLLRAAAECGPPRSLQHSAANSRGARPLPDIVAKVADRYGELLAKPLPTWMELVNSHRVYTETLEELLSEDVEEGAGGAGGEWDHAQRALAGNEYVDSDDDLILIENDVETIDLADDDENTLIIDQYKQMVKQDVCYELDAELGQLMQYAHDNNDNDLDDNRDKMTADHKDDDKGNDAAKTTAENTTNETTEPNTYFENVTERNVNVEANLGLPFLDTGQTSLTILEELDPSQVEAKIIFSDDDDDDLANVDKSTPLPMTVDETNATEHQSSAVTVNDLLSNQVPNDKTETSNDAPKSTLDTESDNLVNRLIKLESPEKKSCEQITKKNFAGPKSAKIKRNIALNLLFEDNEAELDNDILNNDKERLNSEGCSKETNDIDSILNEKLNKYIDSRNSEKDKTEKTENDSNRLEQLKDILLDQEKQSKHRSDESDESENDMVIDETINEAETGRTDHDNSRSDKHNIVEEEDTQDTNKKLEDSSLDKLFLTTKIDLKRIDQYTFWKKNAIDNTIDIKYVKLYQKTNNNQTETVNIDKQVVNSRKRKYDSRDLSSNPDFNPGLKGLSEDYLCRNDAAVKMCRPVTVDLDRLPNDLMEQFYNNGPYCTGPLRARKRVELTDIEDVRRMNRRLLTGLVRPIHLDHSYHSPPEPTETLQPVVDPTEVLTPERLSAILETMKIKSPAKKAKKTGGGSGDSRHCCPARRHLAYILARTRLHARAGRVPPPPKNLHAAAGSAHRRMECSCCCLAAARAAPSVSSLQEELRSLRKHVTRLQVGSSSSSSKAPNTSSQSSHKPAKTQSEPSKKKKKPAKKKKNIIEDDITELTESTEDRNESDPLDLLETDNDVENDYLAYMRERDMVAKYFTLPSSSSAKITSTKPTNVVKAKPTGVNLFKSIHATPDEINIRNIDKIKNDLNDRIRYNLQNTQRNKKVVVTVPHVMTPTKKPFKISVTINENDTENLKTYTKNVSQTKSNQVDSKNNTDATSLPQNVEDSDESMDRTLEMETEELVETPTLTTEPQQPITTEIINQPIATEQTNIPTNTPINQPIVNEQTNIPTNTPINQPIVNEQTNIPTNTPTSTAQPVKKPPWLLNKPPMPTSNNEEVPANRIQIVKPAQINERNASSMNALCDIATSIINSKNVVSETAKEISRAINNNMQQMNPTASDANSQVARDSELLQMYRTVNESESTGEAVVPGAGTRPGVIIVQPSPTQPRIIIQPSMQFVNQVHMQSQNVTPPVPPPVLRHFIIPQAGSSAQTINQNTITMPTVNQNTITMPTVNQTINQNTITMPTVNQTINQNTITMPSVNQTINQNTITMPTVNQTINRNKITMPTANQTINPMTIQVSAQQNILNLNPDVQYVTNTMTQGISSPNVQHIIIKPSIKEWFSQVERKEQTSKDDTKYFEIAPLTANNYSSTQQTVAPNVSTNPTIRNPATAERVFNTNAVSNTVNRQIQKTLNFIRNSNQNISGATDDNIQVQSVQFNGSSKMTTINVSINNSPVSNQVKGNQFISMNDMDQQSSVLNANLVNSGISSPSTNLAEITPGGASQPVKVLNYMLNKDATIEKNKPAPTKPPTALKFNSQSELFKQLQNIQQQQKDLENDDEPELYKILTKHKVNKDSDSSKVNDYANITRNEPQNKPIDDVVVLSDDSDDNEEDDKSNLPTISDVRSLANDTLVKEEYDLSAPSVSQMPKIVTCQSVPDEATVSSAPDLSASASVAPDLSTSTSLAPALPPSTKTMITLPDGGGTFILTVEAADKPDDKKEQSDVPTQVPPTAPSSTFPPGRQFRDSDFSLAAPVRVQDFVSARDLHNLQLLCIDRAKPLLCLLSRYLLVTTQRINIVSPSYWTLTAQNYSHRIMFESHPPAPAFFVDSPNKKQDDPTYKCKIKVKSFAKMPAAGGAGGSGFDTPDELVTDNKLYKKLSDYPLAYAQVWSVVSELRTAVTLAAGDGGLALYDRATARTLPLARAPTPSPPHSPPAPLCRGQGLRCDDAPDALLALVSMMNEYIAKLREQQRLNVVELDSDSDS